MVGSLKLGFSSLLTKVGISARYAGPPKAWAKPQTNERQRICQTSISPVATSPVSSVALAICTYWEARRIFRLSARSATAPPISVKRKMDHEQGDNRGTNGDDVSYAEQANRNQKAEGRFRAVSSQAERLETKDRDTLRRTDLLGAFVTGLDGFTDNEVNDVHERWGLCKSSGCLLEAGVVPTAV